MPANDGSKHPDLIDAAVDDAPLRATHAAHLGRTATTPIDEQAFVHGQPQLQCLPHHQPGLGAGLLIGPDDPLASPAVVVTIVTAGRQQHPASQGSHALQNPAACRLPVPFGHRCLHVLA